MGDDRRQSPNLLSNAFKFTLTGQIEIALQRSGTQVELSVRDTGSGISAADLPHIFERFRRVGNAPARTHEGTGIGLALVQEMVTLHGGSIDVSSSLGVGTTLHVRIPLGHDHLPSDCVGSPRDPATAGASLRPYEPYVEEALRWLPGEMVVGDGIGAEVGALQGIQTDAYVARVLVAEDNADMREYLRRLLARAYRVVTVEDGQRALDYIRSDPPDLALLDVMMPRLDGIAVLEALRRDEGTRTLPVVMLSARAGEEARLEGLKAGADDYLIKPFSARELMVTLSSQLALARVRSEAARTVAYRSEQFETLLNQAPLGVYLVDSDFHLRAVNPIARRVFGDIFDGLIGRDFEAVIHVLWEAHYADEIVRIFKQTLATGTSQVMPERAEYRRDRGITEYYEWRVDRITLPDGNYGLVCYFRDISEQVWTRKALEESSEALEDSDRRRTAFIATLAHELRNPLAPIRNAANILAVAGEDLILRDRASQIIERQVAHMVRLVDDLLDVSRINSGKLELQRALIDVADVISSAVETSKPLIEGAGHRLTVVLPEEPLVLNADSVRLAQILTNLLNNAAKYTPEGGRIWLSAERTDASVVLSVRDDGVGIQPELLSKVFEPFVQAEQSHSRAQGGLGIGLMLVKSLVGLHGGTVEAKSAGVGCGSEFVVRLPAAAERHSQVQLRDRSPMTVKRSILVVDDNRDAADTLALLLELLGAQVYVATSGRAALDELRRHRRSVMFLDIGMPEMDGYEVARQVRLEPFGSEVLLIALTGWGQAEDRRKSADAGIEHHLVKPVDLATLKAVLASVPRREGQVGKAFCLNVSTN